MTPIGHFICSSTVAGNIDLLDKKETTFCFLYYIFFLAAFYVLTFFFQPGPWAMHLHDWAGNAALIFFLILWMRKGEREQYFVCILIGAMILSSYTHAADVLYLKLTGAIPEGMWRPHNVLHTPLAAIVIPAVFTPIVGWIMKLLQKSPPDAIVRCASQSHGIAAPATELWRARNDFCKMGKIFFFLSLGYFLHIVCDTITYSYQIYPLWPVSGYHFSLVSFFQQPDAVSSWLGNPLYVFSAPDVKNIDGFIVYRAEILVNVLLMALFVIKSISNKVIPRVRAT